MSKYNRFGKVFSDVSGLYPGTVTADYDAGGANGQVQIEGALDRAVFEVAASLGEDVYNAITGVDAEKVTAYATAGQTSFQLGMVPIVAGSLHLWLYPLLPPPGAGGLYGSSYGVSDVYYRPPTLGYFELPSTQYSVNATSGLITYTGPAVSVGATLYASYTVDTDNAAFASPMLGQIAMLGAAAELGERLYSQGTQEWALVTQYRERFKALLLQLQEGLLIPDEVRRLDHYTPVEPLDGSVMSVRLFRG